MNNIIETAEVKKGSTGNFDFLERLRIVVEVRWTTNAISKSKNITKGKKSVRPTPLMKNHHNQVHMQAKRLKIP
ncbi:hypothetical protein KBB49_02480 [Candidatus Saccharibacteria bacterium]|nr:hypothetical protein [Candidatus Saccharibacteria bacterium]